MVNKLTSMLIRQNTSLYLSNNAYTKWNTTTMQSTVAETKTLPCTPKFCSLSTTERLHYDVDHQSTVHIHAYLLLFSHITIKSKN